MSDPLPTQEPLPTNTPRPQGTLGKIIPAPLSTRAAEGSFSITAQTVLAVPPGSPEIERTAAYFADKLAPAAGFRLKVSAAAGEPPEGSISLTLNPADSGLGEEGYELTITPQAVLLQAFKPAGLFWGVQTLRQLLPAAAESADPQPGPWSLPCGQVRDLPRFGWRGTMLDVSRHFFAPADVKRAIDLAAYYKINRFHLHLSDDQGWRLEIKSWPQLAVIGGSTQVGGGPGGFYTQAELKDLIEYARQRYIMIVPELEMPSHSNAALASYPELNCDGVAPALYTDIHVGFSSFCIRKEITYKFLDEVLGELAALTPSPYLHIGGDEALSTKHEDYLYFLERLQPIVQSHGKQLIGWEEIAEAKLLPGSIVQIWKSTEAGPAVRQGAKVILSPAKYTYLDMKYSSAERLGLAWAGLIEVKTAYDWDPARQVSGLSEKDILGVEGPLWSETILTLSDIEYMVYPRLIALAEVGWSPLAGRVWEDFRLRLAAHGPRLSALNVNFYRSPQVPWEK